MLPLDVSGEIGRRLEDTNVVTRPSEDDRDYVVNLLHQLTTARRAANLVEATRLRQYVATHILPSQLTARVLNKHAQHVEDDIQWPEDATPDDYLESLRDTVINPRGSIFMAERELDHTGLSISLVRSPTVGGVATQGNESWYSSI
jgi:hypothetical protein